MWLLSSCSGNDQIYLIVGKDYIVGRKDCQILIENDRSISRKHATIKIIKAEQNKTQAILLDHSKFGSSVNDGKVNKQCVLNDGDIIQFGILGSKWRLECKVPIITTSCVKHINDKKAIQDVIFALGGRCLPEWQENCTHLVMDNLKMTVKVVCALASSKPIVKPAYFHNLLKSLQQQESLPDIKKYFPPLEEVCLQNKGLDFHPCEERKKVFHGKNFFFVSSKQLLKLQFPILLGGGEAQLLTMEPEEQLLLKDGNIFINYTQNQTQSNETKLSSFITDILTKHDKRTIQESEIGLAVVFNSVEQYCNPDYSYASTILESIDMTSQANAASQILVSESQVLQNSSTQCFDSSGDLIQPQGMEIQEPVTIPMTSNADCSIEESLSTRKRFHSDDAQSSASQAKMPRLGISCSNKTLECSQSLFSGNTIRNSESLFQSQDSDINDIKSEAKVINLEASTGSQKRRLEDDTQNMHNGRKRNCVASTSSGIEFTDELNYSTNNHLVIEVVSLITKLSANSSRENSVSSSTQNFKKFRKVQSQVPVRAPIVLCDKELIAHQDPCASRSMFGWTRATTLANDQPSQEDLFGVNS